MAMEHLVDVRWTTRLPVISTAPRRSRALLDSDVPLQVDGV
jgi:hypothetical protein